MTMILNNYGWLKEGRGIMQSFIYFGLSISQDLTWTTSLKGRGRLINTQVPRNEGPTQILHEENPTITRHSTHPRHILFTPVQPEWATASTTGLWNNSQYTHTRIHTHTYFPHMGCWHQHISAPSHFITGSVDKKCYSIFFCTYLSFLIFIANHMCEAICDFLFLALNLDWTHSYCVGAAPRQCRK